VLGALILLAVVVVDEVVGDRQVLGPASSWVECQLRDGYFGGIGVVAVCGGIIEEEGDDEAARDSYRGAYERCGPIRKS
jgi:hypothetical protein